MAPEHDCGKDDWLRRELLEYLTVTREGDLVGRPERQRWVTWLESIRPKPEQEWGEEDKEMLEEIIHSVNGYDAITGTIPQNFEQHERKINWLKSLRPQQKQEWSEEDSRILYNVIAYVGYAAKQRGVRDDLFKEANDWLKSLKDRVQSASHWKPGEEKQKEQSPFISAEEYIKIVDECIFGEHKEQKPAEWSEEDESYLQTVINEMEANKKEAREYEHKTYDTIILWLKSLRPQPHWKPSKDQMKILRNYVMGEWRDLTIGQDKILTSLYIDLEKL